MLLYIYLGASVFMVLVAIFRLVFLYRKNI